ncbi:phosphatase PAP2 family protein [Erythrobacter sanguineus]|jgi:multisubunit Na+/H+ antiporter MnhG subunit|uniref:PAP2 superfamily protein n=1 Tax=Erythrobacter sanguineus TaxID=198312 RepID=A0A1M7RUD3_9SPHN|nr:phosphatase PAP2 family protein [Erythrobacter sanguineus]MCR9180536.1 phosphatase PAP2 family protein [Erythrobacteraceae bacterium]SHN49885.1 PAP2 superfamily protein [Erythrobacter sanguineus]
MATLAIRPKLHERLFEGQHRGFYILFALAAVEIAAGVIVGSEPAAYYLLPRDIPDALRFFVPVFIWLAWLGIEARRETDDIIGYVRRKAHEQRYWFLRAYIIVMLLVPANRAFTAIKVAIPRINPFYADHWLAEADRMLFMGVDPWRITHAVIGPTGTLVIDLLYVVWFPIVALLFVWTAFARDPAFQLRASFTHLGAWAVIGSFMAVMLSSVGPCYMEPLMGDDRFVPLMDRLAQQQLFAHGAQEYLLLTLGEETTGSGISAMPSLHVALAALLCILCRDQFGRKHWASRLTLVYAILIWIGSVHLAWHYALDGIVSALAVILLWHGSKYLVADRAAPGAGGIPHPATPVPIAKEPATGIS